MQQYKIENLLREIAPAAKRAKIAKWAIEKPWPQVEELESLYNCPQDQLNRCKELREELYSDWCLGHGIEPENIPQNHADIMDHLAQRLRYENQSAWEEDNSKLYEKIYIALQHIEMGPHGLYLTRQKLDNIPRVANWVLKHFIETAFFTADELEWIETRKKSAIGKETLSYDDEELFAAVLEHMRAHRYEPMTYSRVGADLQMIDDNRERARVNNVLKKMSDPNQQTWMEIVAVKDGEKQFYVWAPARRKLDANQRDWRRILQDEIIDFLVTNPSRGARQIREHCRRAFITISVPRLVDAMNDLEREGRIYFDRGSKNQRHYRVAEEDYGKIGDLFLPTLKPAAKEIVYDLPAW